ncbi:uncharacterized protein [Venturia canescens]|uniref:uncharacterized protein isoform X2 n=1 Tax=Venturia canescens TaxID=32260 RepID=UPI001C9CFDFC|nr:uncharacterized protein LOC122418443 isoform X2 [Venturia canescens]
MTLHWWMHWFWVTAQLAGLLLASPLPSTTQDPRIEQQPASRRNGEASSIMESAGIEPGTTVGSFRVAKAISSYDSPSKANFASANSDHRLDGAGLESTTRKLSSVVEYSGGENDSQITWLLTTSKTPERRKKKNDNPTGRSEALKNFSSKSRDQENKDLTVLPLRIEGARIKLVVNSTRSITTVNRQHFTTRTFNGSEDIEIDQELAEPRLSATAASILQAGISESTRLSRARNAFSSDFQRDDREEQEEAEDRASDVNVNQVLLEAESVNREIETSSSPSIVDIAAITGSCLATIVLLSTMASLGFIMYRRKYLNPPQTLNSDKCSNPDSSGYIDDSTIRDNSEEMYSLDNDSFLNSLEAMTIQNYWTDSVKHTKL